jgi:hypothetical protein
MRIRFDRVLLVGALIAFPVASFAAPPPQKSPSTQHATKTAAADHSTAGVVKSVSSTLLVITRSAKEGGEMSFSMKPSTQREGKIEVGSSVSVRYREDGATHVATAVTSQKAASAK